MSCRPAKPELSPEKPANCDICGVRARRAESAGTVTLCGHCFTALSPLSQAELVRLDAYVSDHPVSLSPAPKHTRPTATISPVSEQLTSHEPTPDTVLTFRKLGYKTEEIADLLQISRSQTRRLLTLANRGTLAETARDFIHTQFLPKVLANIDAALNADSSAEISLKLADKLGLLEPSATSSPPGGADGETTTFETYRLSILKRRTTHHPAEPAPTTVDATSVIDVSDATEEVAPGVALLGQGGSGEGD